MLENSTGISSNDVHFFNREILAPHCRGNLVFLLCHIADIVRHCLLNHAADNFHWVTQQTLSAVSNGRHCLLCHTTAIVCCVTQQTSSAVSHSRPCLLCHTADIAC